MSAFNSGAFVSVVQILFRRCACGLIRAQPIFEGVFVFRLEPDIYCGRTAFPSSVFVTAKDQSTSSVCISRSYFSFNINRNFATRSTI